MNWSDNPDDREPERSDDDLEESLSALEALIRSLKGSRKEPDGYAIVPVRYRIETGLMRDRFFGDPKTWLEVILNDKLFDVWEGILNCEGLDNPYRRDDFAARSLRTDDGTLLVSVSLPRPESITLCYAVYYVYNEKARLARYYTIERTFDGDNAFLCRWSKEGTHYNLGATKIPPERSDPEYDRYFAREDSIILRDAEKGRR